MSSYGLLTPYGSIDLQIVVRLNDQDRIYGQIKGISVLINPNPIGNERNRSDDKKIDLDSICSSS